MARLAALLIFLSMLAGVGTGGQPPRLPRTCALLVATGSTPTYRLTSPAQGVRFDVDGDGVPEQTAWVENVYDVAFLAIDLNGNGSIDSGKELVGGQMFREAGYAIAALEILAPVPGTNAASPTPTPPPRHEYGFIDDADGIWTKLVLWHDLNRNGKSEPEELRPVADVLNKIGMGFSHWNKTDDRGNLWAYRGWVELKHPRPEEKFRDVFDVVCQIQKRD